VSDYLPAHNFGDGVIGPGIVYRPGKTRSSEEVHILALPEELARWVEEWILFTGRAIGDQGPTWPHRKPKPGRPIRRLNASAFGRSISGHAANDGTGSLPLLQRGEDRYHKYNPHSYRHTCYQAMRRAGAQAKMEGPHRFSEQTSDDFARAVVGHDLIRGVGDVYRDLDQPHLARVAIGYAWTELRHQPQRLGPSPAAIDQACERVELLADALSEFAVELGAKESRQRTLSKRRGDPDGKPLDEAVIESNTIVFELARLQREIATTSSRLEQARADLETTLGNEVELGKFDESVYQESLHAAQQRAALALAADEGDCGFLNVKQVAWILDKTTQTINTWIRSGKETSYWDSTAWMIDHRGIRALPVERLAQDALTPLERERLHLARLRMGRTLAA
jgi:hypothetical protein